MSAQNHETGKPLRQQIDDFFNQRNVLTNGLAFLEQKTGVNRIYLLQGGAALLAFYLVVGYSSCLIVSIIGFAYPAYASIKAIESEEKDDDTKWLTYWTVYSSFNVVRYFTDVLMSWFPLYFVFKCAFLLWCMAPFSCNGSVFIYNKFLKPFVTKHEKTIDGYLEGAKERAGIVIDDAKEKAVEVAVEQVVHSSQNTDKKDD